MKIKHEEVLLWLYALLIPYMNLPLFVFSGKKILFSDAAALVLLCLLIGRFLSKGAPKTRAPLLLPVIVMMSVFSASFFLSADKSLSGVSEIFSIAYLAVLFYMVCNIITDKGMLKRFLYVWVFAALAPCAIGAAAFMNALITGNPAGTALLSYTKIDAMAHHFPRVCSTFVVSNMFYSYLHVTIVFSAIGFCLETSRKRKVFLAFAIVVFFIMAVLTGSRRIAGLLLTVFLLLFLSKRRSGLLAAVKASVFAVFLVFLAAYFITSIWVVFPVKIERQPAQRRISISADSSYSLHLISHTVSINMLKAHPFIGAGLGSYNRRFSNYLNWDWVKSSFGYDAYPEYLRSAQDETLNFDPHSLFLGVLAECGLLGFAALFYFLSSYLRQLRAKFKSVYDTEKIVSYGIMAGVIGFLLIVVTMDVLSMRHFWIMLAIGMAAVRAESKA